MACVSRQLLFFLQCRSMKTSTTFANAKRLSGLDLALRLPLFLSWVDACLTFVEDRVRPFPRVLQILGARSVRVGEPNLLDH